MDIFTIATEITTFIRRVVRDELARVERERDSQHQQADEMAADYYQGKDK